MAGSPFWTEHADGSLRNGIEMVLSQPLMGTSLRESISYFFRTFTKYSVTPRTSIHVHVNMRQDNETVEGVRNMITLYYMYEDAFFQIADQNRKWCAYCNAFEDTPPAILEAFMTTDMSSDALSEVLNRSAGHNNNRYYGLNLNALNKFGTIEFRHFPLVTNEQLLIDWLKLIMELKSAANRMADEGQTPWTVFTTPDDIAKLHDYMPLYGPTLTGIVPISRAFHRMMCVRNLGLPRLKDQRQEVVKNKAFRIFQEHQQKLGKKPLAPGKSKNRALLDKLEKEAALFAGINPEHLTLAQRRRAGQIADDILVVRRAVAHEEQDQGAVEVTPVRPPAIRIADIAQTRRAPRIAEGVRGVNMDVFAAVQQPERDIPEEDDDTWGREAFNVPPIPRPVPLDVADVERRVWRTFNQTVNNRQNLGNNQDN